MEQALDRRSIFYMSLLALQFGIQPILTRQFTPNGIVRSTVVLTQEVVKFIIAFSMLRLSNKVGEATKNWTIQSWLSVALVPACLYATQNMAALTAYQNLDGLTFNVLNQTKTLSAALCCYVVMGRRQSYVQVVALLLLLLSALVMEGIVDVNNGMRVVLPEASSKQQSLGSTRHWTHGVGPVLLASFISGLAGALSQRNLQGRNPYLFSMELCAASVLLLTTSLLVSPDGKAILENGFWQGWTPHTFLPILSSSAGGIVVGLVTKYAGSVRKGFALIFGILLSGIIQAILLPEEKISNGQIAGGVLAGLSLYLHSTNPPQQAGASKAKRKIE